jgi:polyhydroxybutyrate depolymerase
MERCLRISLFAIATTAVQAAQVPQGLLEKSLDVNGVKRWFLIREPAARRPAPVVVLLHGGTQSMRKLFARESNGTARWLDVAAREDILLLVPNGTNSRTGDTRGDDQNWADLREDSSAGTKADDVGFVGALLDWTSMRYRVDAKRVYVTGASNGGMMTFRLLLEAPDRFAAAAAFIASLPASYSEVAAGGKRPVPLLLWNGTEDPLIRWAGGTVGRDRGETMAIPRMVDWWARHNRTTSPLEERALPDLDPRDGCRVFRTEYPSRNGAPLIFYRAEGAGHTIPVRQPVAPMGRLVRRIMGPPCHDVDGPELAWTFFERAATQ